MINQKYPAGICYMSEYSHFDGEAFVTLNIVDINLSKREVLIAVTDRGRITLKTFDINPYREHMNDRLFILFGIDEATIYLDEFVNY